MLALVPWCLAIDIPCFVKWKWSRRHNGNVVLENMQLQCSRKGCVIEHSRLDSCIRPN